MVNIGYKSRFSCRATIYIQLSAHNLTKSGIHIHILPYTYKIISAETMGIRLYNCEIYIDNELIYRKGNIYTLYIDTDNNIYNGGY